MLRRTESDGRVESCRNKQHGKNKDLQLQKHCGTEVQIVCLVLPNRSKRQVSTRHDPEKYERLFEDFRDEALEHFGVTIERAREELEGQVLGSFEVFGVVNGSTRYELFSKVKSNRFPTVKHLLGQLKVFLGLDLRGILHAQIRENNALATLRDSRSSLGSAQSKRSRQPKRSQVEKRRQVGNQEQQETWDRSELTQLQRVFISVVSMHDNELVPIQDELSLSLSSRDTAQARVTCMDTSNQMQLSVSSEPSSRSTFGRSRTECFVEAERFSLCTFAVELPGWKQVYPSATQQVFVDHSGPGTIRIIMARVRPITVQLCSTLESRVGRGVGVQLQVDRQAVGSQWNQYVSVRESKRMETDSEGCIRLQEIIGSKITLVGEKNSQDWQFSSELEFEVKSDPVSFPKTMSKGTTQQSNQSSQHPIWLYDSSDDEGGEMEDEEGWKGKGEEAGPTTVGTVQMLGWEEHELNVRFEGMVPQRRWCNIVLDQVCNGETCLCGSRGGGLVVRVSGVDTDFKTKAWCTCCPSFTKSVPGVEGGTDSLGFQALTRYAKVQIVDSNNDRKGSFRCRVEKRTPSGSILCKLTEDDNHKVVQVERNMLELEPAELEHDIWSTVQDSIEAYSCFGYPSSKSGQPVQVCVRIADPQIGRSLGTSSPVTVVLAESKTVVGKGFLDSSSEMLEFPHGLETDVFSGQRLWLCPPGEEKIQVVATSLIGGFSITGFGSLEDGSRGSPISVCVISPHVGILQKKAIRLDPIQKASNSPRVSIGSAEMPGRGKSRVSISRQVLQKDLATALWAQQSKKNKLLGSVVVIPLSEWNRRCAVPLAEVNAKVKSGARTLPASMWSPLPAPLGVTQVLLPVDSRYCVALQPLTSREHILLSEDLQVTGTSPDKVDFLLSLPKELDVDSIGVPQSTEQDTEQQEKAAVKIQTNHRRRSAQQSFQRQRSCSRLLQNWYRFKNHMLNRHQAARKIQGVFRTKHSVVPARSRRVHFRDPVTQEKEEALEPSAEMDLEDEYDQDGFDNEFEDFEATDVNSRVTTTRMVKSESVTEDDYNDDFFFDDDHDSNVEEVDKKREMKSSKTKTKKKKKEKQGNSTEFNEEGLSSNGQQAETHQKKDKKKSRKKKTSKREKDQARPMSAMFSPTSSSLTSLDPSIPLGRPRTSPNPFANPTTSELTTLDSSVVLRGQVQHAPMQADEHTKEHKKKKNKKKKKAKQKQTSDVDAADNIDFDELDDLDEELASQRKARDQRKLEAKQRLEQALAGKR